jgi:Short C-terminal domain
VGFMRKALFLGTGGLSGAAGIKANSKKERTAKAAEKQLRLQKQMAKEQRQASRAAATAQAPQATAAERPKYKVPCPHCSAPLVARAGDNITCPKCRGLMRVTARGGSAVASVVESHASASGSSMTDELERLATLHSNGALSEAEFEAAKRKLLQ